MEVLEAFLKSMEAVTIEDIDAEIATIDEKIKSTTEDLLKRRDALIAAKRIVLARTEGAPQRKPRKPRKIRSDKGRPRNQDVMESHVSGGPAGSVIEKVSTHLKFAGPTRIPTLAKAIMEDEQAVRSCLLASPKRFIRDADGAYFLK